MRKVMLPAIAVTAISTIFFLYHFFQKPDITIAEAGEMLAQQYNGTVIQSGEENGQFIYTIQVAAQGEYEMAVNRETGELISMTRVLKEAAPAAEPEQEQRETARQLTAEEAGQLALSQVPGVIDEVELGDEEEAGFYIVDIDADSGGEATVQINAISGEVTSISWDD